MYTEHEKGVNQFYGTGAENFGEFHGGYLNFGLWTKGITNYIDAAENMVKHMGKLVGLNKKSKLLDVACGMGPDTLLLHKTFNCKIEAIDITEKHVQHVQRRITEARLQKHITAQRASATNIPFKENTFTQLISIEGPEHFDTREKFFKEAYRVLKPGGVIGLTDYILVKQPTKLWEKIFVYLGAKLWHVPKENYDTFETYREKLQKYGFTNITIEKAGAETIPPYYFEQKRKQVRRELRKIRGWWATYPGHLIDVAVYKVYKHGLIEYGIVRAEKPNK